MHTRKAVLKNRNSLSSAQRLSRVMFGATLIGITLAAPSGPLGWLVALPILAILPVITGLTGMRPLSLIYAVFPAMDEKARLSAAAKIELFAIGIILMTGVWFGSETMAAVMMPFAVIGVVPIIIALLGQDVTLNIRDYIVNEIKRPLHVMTPVPGIAVMPRNRSYRPARQHTENPMPLAMVRATTRRSAKQKRLRGLLIPC